MDRQELATRINDAIYDAYSLTKERVENRASNIRKVDSYILFDIERHPGAGDTLAAPDNAIQTWRYDDGTSALERVCTFAASYMDTLKQNKVGEPVCRHCGTDLDPHADVFDFIWRCADCGAVGGKEKEIFNPTLGEPLGKKSDYEEREDGLWVPIDTCGS